MTSGNYCDIASAVRPSRADILSDGTATAILTENTKLEKLCGVKP